MRGSTLKECGARVTVRIYVREPVGPHVLAAIALDRERSSDDAAVVRAETQPNINNNHMTC